MTPERWRAASLVLALGVFTPAIALADDEIEPNALHAEKLADEAGAKERAGAFSDAIDLYVEAYKASPAAVLLFNVAVIYDRHLHNKNLALDYYNRALAQADLEESLASQARTRISALDTKDEKDPNAGAVASPSEHGWHPLKIASVATVGAGLVSLGTSGILALVAKSKDDEVDGFCDGDRCTDARALDLTNDATSLANAATATLVIGSILVAGGIVLWLVAPSRTTASPPRTSSARGLTF